MTHRYDRDYDPEDYSGRRDDRDGRPGYRRDDVEHAYGWSGPRGDQRSRPYSGEPPRRYGEGREQSSPWPRDDERRSAWRGEGYERDPYETRDQHQSSQGGYPRDAGREWDRSFGERGYSDRGYGDRSYGDRGYADRSASDRAGRSFSDRSFGERGRDDQSERWSRDRPSSVRGLYQEQVWTRDPTSGRLYGYEYTTRYPSNAGDYREHAPRWEEQRRDPERGSRMFGSHSVDALRGAGHAGKGPKGYVRSDERIREDICDRLSDDDEIDASEITVTVTKGEVRLEGSVADRYAKHRAEDIAESVSGVRDVSNHLRARKGLLRELGDKLSGEDHSEHRGHAGSGTRNAPVPNGGVGASR